MFNAIVHWLHLTAAIAAVGGIIFIRFVLHPAAQALEDDARAGFEREVRKKFSMIVMLSILVLVFTGLINIMRVFADGAPAGYGGPLVLKILLALAMFMLTFAILVPSEAFAKIHANRPFWIMVNIIIGLTVVLLSAYLRLMPRGVEIVEAASELPLN